MNRRGFLIGVLAAPAIVRASSLMPIAAPKMLRYNTRWRIPLGWGSLIAPTGTLWVPTQDLVTGQDSRA